ncbi:MAG: ABC transporter substrate binding protein [Motiliproteus sp.]
MNPLMFSSFLPPLLPACLLLLRVVLAFTLVGSVAADSHGHRLKMMVVDSSQGEPYQTVREAMLAELRVQGIDPALDIEMEYFSLGNFSGPARYIWKEAQEENYDLIFVNGTVATAAFKDLALGAAMPFIFAAVTDPVGIGVIDGFERPPPANFTGVSYPVNVEARLRFIRRLMPEASKIGLIYAEMPQSESYKRWLDQALKKPEFKDLEVIYRSVPYVKSEGGHIRMAQLARRHVEDLDALVDLFLSPNDQMGVQPSYARMVYASASKPLVGLGRKDVVENWGATMSLYPSLERMGWRVAHMIIQWENTRSISLIQPQCAETGVAFDLEKAAQFKLSIPADLMEQAGENDCP